MESLHSLWECDDDLSDVEDVDHLQPASSAALSARELLEDGEVGPASHSLQSGVSFQFTSNDLDDAVRSSKKVKQTNAAGRRRNKRTKKSAKKRAQETDPKAFVARISRFLKEPKHYLVEAAVERLGIEVLRDLVDEVKTIEKNGGQLVSSGERRRTPGGVLWNVVRSRYGNEYKAIMAAGRTFEKEQRQQKRKVDINEMAIDEQPSTKRSRTGLTVSSLTSLKPAEVKRTGVIIWPSRCAHIHHMQGKVDPDNRVTLSRVQNAWAESVKKGKDTNQDKDKPKLDVDHDDVEVLDDGMNRKPSMAERLRIPILYDDL